MTYHNLQASEVLKQFPPRKDSPLHTEKQERGSGRGRERCIEEKDSSLLLFSSKNQSVRSITSN